ncbi:MAG: RNA 2',3'-cyclic phosphodiesterase [Planctomycetota bacterium]|nr:RNA 2',3'-cyclic phosphodiesterase [Planctomycetota bacterium]MDA1178810.1 RNA 2',3'-cyclic phosphodiesterase [Planctomycetota bacterium]
MKRIRTFVAIDLPRHVCAAAGGLIGHLQSDMDSDATEVQWVQPELMHITVKFLGDVDEVELAEVCRGVELACQGCPPIELDCRGLGVFPRPDRPRTIWLGLTGEGCEVLKQLQARVETQMFRLGFLHEKRRYEPHVTLGRVRGNAEWLGLAEILQRQGPCTAGRIVVDELTVYASRLSRGGPAYMPLARIPLE